MPSRTTVKLEYNHFPEIARKMPGAAISIIGDTLDEIDATVQNGMASSGGGRVYTRGGRVHQASVPGAMPAIDTGALAGSMQHEIIRGKYTGYYYTENPVGAYMEFGTSTIAPRPFITPAAERARPNFMRKMRALEAKLK